MTLKETPIIMSTPMVQALQEGRKTQTRRLVKANLSQIQNPNFGYSTFTPDGHISTRGLYEQADGGSFLGETFLKLPYGPAGNLLYVRESYLPLMPEHIITSPYVYKANADPDTENVRQNYLKQNYPYQWKPSIHMPKDAARIWLFLHECTIERLQDIAATDAEAEGTPFVHPFARPEDLRIAAREARWIDSFRLLWETIHGAGAWKANPYVWKLTFEVLSTTGREDAYAKINKKVKL